MEQAIDVLAACEPDIVVHGHSLDSFAPAWRTRATCSKAWRAPSAGCRS